MDGKEIGTVWRVHRGDRIEGVAVATGALQDVMKRSADGF